MTQWVALDELLLPTGPQFPHQKTIGAGLDNPQGPLPSAVGCYILHCFECAVVITMTNMFSGWNISASQGPAGWSGFVCVLLSEGNAPFSSQSWAAAWTPAHTRHGGLAPGAHEFHGSSWSPTSGSDPGSG